MLPRRFLPAPDGGGRTASDDAAEAAGYPLVYAVIAQEAQGGAFRKERTGQGSPPRIRLAGCFLWEDQVQYDGGDAPRRDTGGQQRLQPLWRELQDFRLLGYPEPNGQ